MTEAGKGIQAVLDDTITVLKQVVGAHRPGLRTQEVGRVRSVGNGIVLVAGLPGVRSEELIRFPGGLLGVTFNVDPSEAGVILLGETGDLQAGAEARRTGGVLDVPVGEALLGRVVDALGRPLDDLGPIRTLERRPVEREAPPIMARAPVTVPLQTGLKVVDALVPIGRGQRELILGDRTTGKTAIVLDTLINQRDQEVICVYCAIGQRDTRGGRPDCRFAQTGGHGLLHRGGGPRGSPAGAPFCGALCRHFHGRILHGARAGCPDHL